MTKSYCTCTLNSKQKQIYDCMMSEYFVIFSTQETTFSKLVYVFFDNTSQNVKFHIFY